MPYENITFCYFCVASTDSDSSGISISEGSDDDNTEPVSRLLTASGVAEEVGVRGCKRQQERVMTTEYSATAPCLKLRR